MHHTGVNNTGGKLPPVSTTLAANLPPVSRTPAANFATSSPCVVDTGGKFATGVNYTGGKFAAGVNDAGGKLHWYQQHRWQICHRCQWWEQYQAADTWKWTWWQKFIYMFPLLPKGDQTKLLKFFWLKIFSICHRCCWHRWQTLGCKYLRKFSKKFETVLMEYPGAGRKLIHEKNQKQKISWHCPFNLSQLSGVVLPARQAT